MTWTVIIRYTVLDCALKVFEYSLRKSCCSLSMPNTFGSDKFYWLFLFIQIYFIEY